MRQTRRGWPASWRPAASSAVLLVSTFLFVSFLLAAGLALTFYQEKWALSQTEASAINSLVYIISAVASPLFGFGVDVFGRNLLWVRRGEREMAVLRQGSSGRRW